VPLGVPVHPVPLYEAGAEAVTAALLIAIILKGWYKFHLEPALIYFLTYAFVRFGFEFLRDDPRGAVGALSTSQVVALCVVAVALPLYVMGAVRGTVIFWKPRVPGGDARVPATEPALETKPPRRAKR
jgi:phosphatidylglycerol:prolipoprotein diacylglycerol transferase